MMWTQYTTTERLELIHKSIGSKSVPVLKGSQQDTIRLHKSLHTEPNTSQHNCIAQYAQMCCVQHSCRNVSWHCTWMLPTGYWCTHTKAPAATPACTNPPSPTTQQSSLHLMLLVPSWMSYAESFYLPWKYIYLLSKQIHINPKGKLWQYCRQQAAEVSQSFQLNLSVKSLPGRQSLIRLGTHFAVW